MIFLNSIRQIAFRTFDNNISLIVILDVGLCLAFWIIYYLLKFVNWNHLEDAKSVRDI